MTKVTSINRDASGNLLSWVENGYTFTVARDGSGKVSYVTGKRANRATLVCEFKYTESGAFSGATSDVASPMIDALITAAAGIAIDVGGGSGEANTPVSSIVRDTGGRVTRFTAGGVENTVTYDGFGISSISNGSSTTTLVKNTYGVITGVTVA